MTKTCNRWKSPEEKGWTMVNTTMRKSSTKRTVMRWIALMAAVCLLPLGVAAEAGSGKNREWIDFFLICNEGMSNTGGNSGNTMMIVSMNPNTGKIRLVPFTWDTFVYYEGYDVPQKIDMPYRNNGPEETMKVFNDNFHMDIDLFMSLNYLNLASLIDAYGGVDIDISRAERNALNSMVASKKENITAQASLGFVSQMMLEQLTTDYYLNEYGPGTHLNGLQAVGYGWLQYDSVYNCCERDVKVISNLFYQVGKTISEKVVLYTDESGAPENTEGHRAINLDNMSNDDAAFLRSEMSPIFMMAYHNLSEEEIHDISLALLRSGYLAARQGVGIFTNLQYEIYPQEAKNEYETIAGTKGHLVDYKANEEAMKAFLFNEDWY